MSAVKHADLIIVMNEGRIIERGNHATLMSKKGWYYDTYQAQALQEQLSRNLDSLTKGDGEND